MRGWGEVDGAPNLGKCFGFTFGLVLIICARAKPFNIKLMLMKLYFKEISAQVIADGALQSSHNGIFGFYMQFVKYFITQ